MRRESLSLSSGDCCECSLDIIGFRWGVLVRNGKRLDRTRICLKSNNEITFNLFISRSQAC